MDLLPQLYKVTFHLSKVLNVPSNMRDFVFQFQTKNIDLNIYVDGLSPHGDDLSAAKGRWIYYDY